MKHLTTKGSRAGHRFERQARHGRGACPPQCKILAILSSGMQLMSAKAVQTFTLAQKQFCWSGLGVRSTATADRNMAPHRHSFFQIFFVAAGTAVHEIAGQVFHANAGSIFFVSPYTVHRVVFPADAECYVIYFSAQFILHSQSLADQEALQDANLYRLPELAPFVYQAHCVYQLDKTQTAEARQHCRSMLRACESRGIFDASRARAELTLLLTLVGASYLHEFQRLDRAKEPTTVVDKRVRVALNYLKKHFRKNVTLNEVASHVHLTGTYLTYLLKQEIGKTYKQLLDELRLEHSKQLLAYTDMPLQHVAEDSGFLDQAHFTRRFRAYAGSPPGEYRRKCQAPLQGI